MSSPPPASDALPGLGTRKGVPKLSASVDWSALQLDDVQGFVLSRVDGRTSLGEICLLVPFPEAQTAGILRDLFARSVIDVPNVPRPPLAPPPRPVAAVQHSPTAAASSRPAARAVITPAAPPAATAGAAAAGEAEHRVRRSTPGRVLVVPTAGSQPSQRAGQRHADAMPMPEAGPEAAAARLLKDTAPSLGPPRGMRAMPETVPSLSAAAPAPRASRGAGQTVDLPPEVRARIDHILSLLDDTGGVADPHALLGVPAGVDKKELKRAYFKLSKEFHPDRYFKRELGEYKRHLQRVFNAVNQAYESLGGS